MNLRKILTSILLILVGTASAEVTSGFYRIRSNSYAGRYITENRNYITLDLSDNTTYYSLGKKNDKIGFYKFEKSGSSVITLGANKAYLDTPAASSARGFVFDIDNPTGIESMYDGQGTMYDLSGRRVDSLKRGIYIVNGKKIIK
ncbi:MAG: hypothetical protein IJQ05_03195 [Bacteroidaceae bacterium]|nr:hypothetical protein [Bacteroidaceae bacterium]